MPINNWREHANCARADPEPFDQPHIHNLSDHQRDQVEHTIASFCGHCPVKKQCLTAAIDHGDTGIRGGILITDEALRKFRRRIGATR